jgi:hypothetical protein
MSAMQSPNGRGGEDCAAGRSTWLDRVRVPSVLLRDKRGFAALEGQPPKENPAAIRIEGHRVWARPRPSGCIGCSSPGLSRDTRRVGALLLPTRLS